MAVSTRAMWVRLLAALLACGAALAATVAGCARTPNSSGFAVAGDDSGGGGSFDLDAGAPGVFGGGSGTCSADLQTIAITPPTVSAQVTYGWTGPAFVHQLLATGTFPDGGITDVTACVAWSVSAPDLATVKGGTFATTVAGQYTVSAKSGIAAGTAVVTVKMSGIANSGNIPVGSLDGTPGGAPPRIAYPIDGALFPYHFGDLAFQIVPSAPGQTVARIAFEGDAIDVKVYAPCAPIANATESGACSIALPPELEPALAGASEGTTLTETVRLAAADGSHLAESAPIDVRWASRPLPGSIYYWSAPPASMQAESQIVRMNLDKPGTPPEVFYQWHDSESYAPSLSGGWACIGCHAISQDGKKMGITIGGAAIAANGDGNGSFFALIDIATRTPTAARIVDNNGQFLKDGFATLTTFSPDDQTMVQELQGQLYLREANAGLASQPLFPSLPEKATHPYWSAKGDLLAFTGWVPDGRHAYDSMDLNGNETNFAEIWISAVTGTTFGAPTLLVPRVANATEYYPAISDDSAWIVFNESSCGGPPSGASDGYGLGPCDGYDDPSARLRVVSSAGGAPMELDRASGRTSGWPASGTWGNSWPRFSPAHGSFHGKNLYWVAFSSRRAYGAVLKGSENGSSVPQIWFAAVAIDPAAPGAGDPSFSPVWLPLQNSPTPEVLWDGGSAPPISQGGITGNHVPQWVYQYVSYDPPKNPPPPPPK